MPPIKTLTVLGTGVLGSQIAYQAAFHGFAVTAYDVDDDALGKARGRFDRLAATYRAHVPGAAASTARWPGWRRRRRSSPPTPRRCSPAILRNPPAGPTGSLPSTTPTTSGRRTSPR